MTTRTAMMRLRRRYYRLRWLVLHPTRKLAGLRATQWRCLLEAQAALLWAQALVWVRPLGKLVDSAPAARSGTDAPFAPPQGGSAPAVVGAPAAAGTALPELPRELALGVRRAAAYGVFRPLCLVRSVALNRLLERHGFVGSRIRVGVRWVDGKFAAHAWVEYEGHVLGDDVEHVSRFADLSEVRLLKWS